MCTTRILLLFGTCRTSQLERPVQHSVSGLLLSAGLAVHILGSDFPPVFRTILSVIRTRAY